MNRFKIWLAGAAIAAAAGGSVGTAQAAPFVCDNVGVKCQFDGETGGFGGVTTSAGQSATDVFNLVFAKAGKFTVSLTTSKLTLLNFSFAGSNVIAPVKGQDYSFNILAAGPYELKVNTFNPTSKLASFSATFDFAAVPEPAAWGMMIAGIGLAGTALRRRRAQRPAIA